MNRRDFVSRVALGAAVACTNLTRAASAAPADSGFRFRFVGMMAFVERKDGSFLVATPGQSHHHMTHVPFLMARAGSELARALNMTAVPGVVPAAFDLELEGTQPSQFVYRSLENTTLEIVNGAEDRVANRASQMAHLADIAPGKRARGNLEKWASSTVSLRGGQIENSAAHPDAGKLWSFGAHRQLLTDAVNYRSSHNSGTTLRLTSGIDARTITIEPRQSADLWLFSTTAFDDRMNNPTKLIHSQLLFEFLVGAAPVLAECPEATGREVPATAMPFVRATSASSGIIGSEAAMPPFTDLCFIADLLLGGTD